MQNYSKVMKWERYEQVYRTYANDVYKVCLHFSQDKQKAADDTEKVFVEFYDEFEDTESDQFSALLIRKAKNLAENKQV